MASSPLKIAAGHLICLVLAQGLFVGLNVRGVELAQTPAHATPSLHRCAAGTWHRQRMAALHAFSLLAVDTSAYVALTVKIHRSDRPAAWIRASMLLAVALSLAATVLGPPDGEAGHRFLLLLSVVAKGGVWAYALMGLVCAWRHGQLAAVPSGPSKLLDGPSIEIHLVRSMAFAARWFRFDKVFESRVIK